MITSPRAVLALSLLVLTGCSSYLSTAGPDHCGAIGSGEIWGKDLSPHQVTCDVTVTGDLTIGPGATIEFAKDAALLVRGTLRVEGTADNPVIMSASSDEPWVGVHVLGAFDDEERMFPDPSDLPIDLAAGDVHIAHLQISGAGANTTLSHGGGLIVERGPVHVSNVTIDGSPGCGLLLLEGGSLSGDSGGIELNDNATAVCAHPESVSVLDAEQLTIADAENQRIEVVGGTMSGRHTWSNLGVPYYLSADLTLFRGELEVEAGTTLLLDSGVSFIVGDDQLGPEFGRNPEGAAFTRRQSSVLNLAGTAEAPVRFAPAGEEPWGRLMVDVGSVPDIVDGEDVEILEGGATLSHVILEGGGQIAADPLRPATLVTRRRAFVHADNLTITGSDSGGLWLEGGGFTAVSRGVSVTGSAFAGYFSPDAAGTLPEEGSTYVNNNNGGAVDGRLGDVFYVAPGVVGASTTWADLGLPWQLEGSLDIGSGSTDVMWTVAAGNELRVPSDTAIVIGQRGPAGVVIGEDGGEEVLFTYGEWGAAGDHWYGLQFDAMTLPSTIHATRLHLAGSDLRGAALYLRSGPGEYVTVDGVTIEDPAHVGFKLGTPLAPASKDLTVKGAERVGEAMLDVMYSVPEEGANFTENVDPYVATDGLRMVVTGAWGDIGVPYRTYEGLSINGYLDEAEEPQHTVLTLEAGAVFEFDDAGSLRAELSEGVGSLQALGTVDNPVIMRAIPDGDNWRGLFISSESLEDSKTKSVLKNLFIDDAGRSEVAALRLTDASPTLDNVHVRRSESFGVYLSGTSFLTDVNRNGGFEGEDEDAFWDAHDPEWFVWGEGDDQNNPAWVASPSTPDRNVQDGRPWAP